MCSCEASLGHESSLKTCISVTEGKQKMEMETEIKTEMETLAVVSNLPFLVQGRSTCLFSLSLAPLPGQAFEAVEVKGQVHT